MVLYMLAIQYYSAVTKTYQNKVIKFKKILQSMFKHF